MTDDYSDAIAFGEDTYSAAQADPHHAGQILGTAAGSVVLPGIGGYLGGKLGTFVDGLIARMSRDQYIAKHTFEVDDAIYLPEVDWYFATQSSLVDSLAKLTADERSVFARVANMVAGPPLVWTGGSGHHASQTGPWFVPRGGPSGSKLLGYVPASNLFPESPPMLSNDGRGMQTFGRRCPPKHPLRTCIIRGPQTVGLLGVAPLLYMGDDVSAWTNANAWDPARAVAHGKDVALRVGAGIAGGMKAVEQYQTTHKRPGSPTKKRGVKPSNGSDSGGAVAIGGLLALAWWLL